MKRYAVVGTGARAELYVRALARGAGELVGFADVNATRMAVHNDLVRELGNDPVPTYRADEFLTMLDEQRVDVVIVTTVDRYHDTYIVEALDAGREVITEKPMTVDAPSCAKILEAVHRNDGKLTVTFNYRYNPVHEKVRQVLASGEIGRIGSVHFEWLLDVRHGADYFRRWHRDKANSGGLLVADQCRCLIARCHVAGQGRRQH
ncbi:Gfo/Idh/MocA family protein [Kibdelosporangium lantanae]|uniref:Gfo/Idh/MocA family protein n=1 Tax=Kibdelosporangium lantanae TaxID=1497396 RepID=A0ABW3ME31_9PSEU